MEEQNFEKVYSAGKPYEAELIVGLLAEHGIKSTIINKRDREFLIGEVEVYVSVDNVDEARKIIDIRGE